MKINAESWRIVDAGYRFEVHEQRADGMMEPVALVWSHSPSCQRRAHLMANAGRMLAALEKLANADLEPEDLELVAKVIAQAKGKTPVR